MRSLAWSPLARGLLTDRYLVPSKAGKGDRLFDEGTLQKDMESGKLIDRLVCGDVGYGKTEVALRAAFKAAVSGQQVAVLTPTTVLADQHFHVFSQRFKPYPITVEALSRLKSKDEVVETHTFTQMAVNDSIRDSTFEFEPPEDVDVLIHDEALEKTHP